MIMQQNQKGYDKIKCFCTWAIKFGMFTHHYIPNNVGKIQKDWLKSVDMGDPVSLLIEHPVWWDYLRVQLPKHKLK